MWFCDLQAFSSQPRPLSGLKMCGIDQEMGSQIVYYGGRSHQRMFCDQEILLSVLVCQAIKPSKGTALVLALICVAESDHLKSFLAWSYISDPSLLSSAWPVLLIESRAEHQSRLLGDDNPPVPPQRQHLQLHKVLPHSLNDAKAYDQLSEQELSEDIIPIKEKQIETPRANKYSIKQIQTVLVPNFLLEDAKDFYFEIKPLHNIFRCLKHRRIVSFYVFEEVIVSLKSPKPLKSQQQSFNHSKSSLQKRCEIRIQECYEHSHLRNYRGQCQLPNALLMKTLSTIY